MTDYKTTYFQLAAKVADAIDLLIGAQREAEEACIKVSDCESKSEKSLDNLVEDND